MKRPTDKRVFITFLATSSLLACICITYYDTSLQQPILLKAMKNASDFPPSSECFCGGEEMCFPLYVNGQVVRRGRRFNCAWKKYLNQLKVTEDFNYEREGIDPNEIVFAMVGSSNHFTEVRYSIREMRKQINNTIVFVDVGVSKEEEAELRSVCNLVIRKIPFDKYPPNIRRLGEYRFKGIALAEVFNEFKTFWFIDSSVKFNASHAGFYKVELGFGKEIQDVVAGHYEDVVVREHTFHSNFAVTHPTFFQWLPMEPSKYFSIQFGDGTIFVRRSNFSRDFVKWYVLCSLEPECLNPTGAQGVCHGLIENPIRRYSGCHRYDQITVNSITASLVEGPQTSNRTAFNRMDNRFLQFWRDAAWEVDKKPLNGIACPR